MTLLKLPIILAAAMVFRSTDAACVEDNCYGGETLETHINLNHSSKQIY